MARQDEIRLIAYHIWEEEGCVEGQDCEHWYRAEAIWEQNQKASARATRPVPKQIASQSVKPSSASKKSRRR